MNDPTGPTRILVLNAGSSTLKASIVDLPPGASLAGLAARPPATLVSRTVEWGADASVGGDPERDLRALLDTFERSGITTASLAAVGYRVVHGGARFAAPTRIDTGVIAEVEALRRLAPLHNGVAAMTMRAGLAALPRHPHVAVFDTAFHATLEPAAYRYPLAAEWHAAWGVRKFGFHGISVAWAAARAAALLDLPGPRLVVAHLGSGCSVTAVDAGRSVDTSMGMTPLEGLMMGTRSGSIDPGVLFWAMREGHRTPEALAEELDHRAGLLGVSGTSADVRDLLTAAGAGDPDAELALAMFEWRTAAAIGSAATALPSLDAVVFTGGIGEHAAPVRARIVGRLAALGVSPLPAFAAGEVAERGPDAATAGDGMPNGDGPPPGAGAASPGAPAGAALPAAAQVAAGDGLLSDAGASGPRVLRVTAREDLVIAAQAAALLA